MVFSSVFKVGFPSGISDSAGGMSSAVSNLSVVDKYFPKEFRSWIKTPGHFSDVLDNQWVFPTISVWSHILVRVRGE